MSSWDEHNSIWQPPVEAGATPPPTAPAWFAAAQAPPSYPVAGATPPARPSRGPIRLLLSSAAVLTVIAVLLPVLGSTTTASASVLVTAARSTLAEKTADLTLSGSVSADGQTVPVNGSGALDFVNHEMSLSLGASADGRNVTVNEVLAADTLYMEIPGISTLEPGKSWVSMDLSQLKSASAPSGSVDNVDPVAMLQLLEQQGYTVNALGQSQVDGDTVNGYEVDISSSQIQAEINKEPAYLRQAASALDVSSSGITIDVYVNATDQVRRMSLSMQITSAGTSLDESVNLDFSQYGAPVDVTVPPSDQVVSYQQFLQDSGVSGS